MTGWKTWAAAIGTMATGVSMVAAGIAAEAIDPDQVWTGILTFMGGLAMVGIGHKIEKNKAY
jgi:hypothetical protein